MIRLLTAAFALVAGIAILTAANVQAEPASSPPDRAGNFRAGAVALDITPRNAPPNPPSIILGGFLESRADRVHDPLLVRAIVLDDGGGDGRGAVSLDP